VLTVRPCAAEHYEPRQVRKEAAVSSQFWVPQVILVGVANQGKAIRRGRNWVHDPIFFGRVMKMSRPLAAEAREFLDRFGLRARKSLGQHFLVDRQILRRIVSAAQLATEDTVIEIGPGLGILTRELAKRAGKVIAVEADGRLASALSETMAGVDNVSIVEADILQTDPGSLLTAGGVEGSPPRYKVVANIPYYITSRILRHFLEATRQPSSMVVMVQREVGEAITARPGRMSILAVSVQFYGKPAIVGHVPAQSFYPPPKVESVILRIEPYEHPAVEVTETGAFFAVVRAGFSAPRKQLRNSLAQGLGIAPQEAAAFLEGVRIDYQRRAEALSLEEWARLSEEVSMRLAGHSKGENGRRNSIGSTSPWPRFRSRSGQGPDTHEESMKMASGEAIAMLDSVWIHDQ